ncbi:hypothetical protein QA597_03770 [Marinilabiliaceae bacterium ANBcel2]|nr:hypothetical protein [Marinilabiliaceae bacterium ANBcel2]
MKMIFNPATSIGLILVSALLIVSCNFGGSSRDRSQQQSAETLDRERVEQDVREFVYPLPTTFEVTEMLNRIGAAYILTLSNPPSNVDRYLTEKSKAINLGIYSADLSYASTYNQKQETIDYMEVSKTLIDALNISGAVSADIIEQVEEKQDDKDELIKLITNTFYDTYEHLNQNNRGEISMLVLAGSWVEALYIATHISEDTFNNKEMVKIVMDQKSSLNKLMELMSVFKDNRAVSEVIDQLTPIHNIYNSIDDGSITERQMNAIIKEINEVRTQMVS